MDSYKLLSRSTKLSKASSSRRTAVTPSSGQTPVSHEVYSEATLPLSRKRKRHADDSKDASLNFFSNTDGEQRTQQLDQIGRTNSRASAPTTDNLGDDQSGQDSSLPSAEESRGVLRKHKVKLTWLNPAANSKTSKKATKSQVAKSGKRESAALFVQPFLDFAELRSRYSVSPQLAQNVSEEGYVTSTQVQLAALPMLMNTMPEVLRSASETISASDVSEPDLLSVAPTGSGKTLAFMIPLIHRLIQRKRASVVERSNVSAIILAPTKELASQIVNEGRKLAKNTGIRVTQARKGMRFAASPANDTDDARSMDEEQSADPASVVKADILVSTPGILETIIKLTQKDNPVSLSHVCYLVLDEADVLLDPLFREQTLTIWHGLTHDDLRVSLWSATMGSNIEELAKSVIHARMENLQSTTSRKFREAPLVRLVIGLKDSALPNVRHRLVYAASEQGKLMGLRQLLHPATNSLEDGPPLLPPFLVFTQTIERAVALHSELRYDIPAEAGGIDRIAVLHSDLSDTARDSIMKRFRKNEVWILITTDLLSRGIDFRGVNGVVNYDIPTSSAAYVHRAGRTGRAGREGGVAVTLYSKEDIPYLKHIANLVATAEQYKSSGDETGVQKWLLDSLPTLSKNAKQDLKKHGIESRTARGMQKDPRTAKKARISTKAGFVRREENKRKGAILGSQRRQEAASEHKDDNGFRGFD